MRHWIGLAAVAAIIAWHPIDVAAQDAVHVIPGFTFESGENGRRLQSGAGVDAMTTTQSIARKVAKRKVPARSAVVPTRSE